MRVDVGARQRGLDVHPREGLQRGAALGVLPGIPAAEHGGAADVRRFGEAAAFREEAAQSRCARGLAEHAAK